MLQANREIAWFKAAAKEFETFPIGVKRKILGDLLIAAQGEKGEISKPLKGLGGGVFEVAVKYRTDAFRTVYAVQIGKKIWVLHAFKKKSKSGTKTPKLDIDLIKSRMKKAKELEK